MIKEKDQIKKVVIASCYGGMIYPSKTGKETGQKVSLKSDGTIKIIRKGICPGEKDIPGLERFKLTVSSWTSSKEISKIFELLNKLIRDYQEILPGCDQSWTEVKVSYENGEKKVMVFPYPSQDYGLSEMIRKVCDRNYLWLMNDK